MQTRTLVVPIGRVSELERAVRSLARTARKIGLQPEPSMVVEHKTRRELPQTVDKITIIEGSVEGQESTRRVVPVVDCVLTLPDDGVAVAGDWRVLATIQPTEKGNEMFCRPVDLPRLEPYRACELECEHCKANRNRSKTLVVEEVASGRLLQLGKECAVLYVGDRVDNEVKGLEFQEYLSLVLKPFEETPEGYCGGGVGSLRAWDSDEVLAHSFACVRTRGWEPASIEAGPFGGYEENPNATAKHVADVLGSPGLYDPKRARGVLSEKERAETEETLATLRQTPNDANAVWIKTLERRLTESDEAFEKTKARVPYEVRPEDREMATKALAWLDAQHPDAASPDDAFMVSMKAAYEPGWISEKRLRFAVSLVRAYQRGLERAETERLAAISQYVGTVGDRREFVLTVIGKSGYETDFGYKEIYRMRDQSGNAFTWFTHAGLDVDSEGKTFRVKATIKEHDEYKGMKQTVLSRVKVIEPYVPTCASEPGEEAPTVGAKKKRKAARGAA